MTHSEIVWGTDVYTRDSSICSAAVYAGTSTMESGISVTIGVRPGESYTLDLTVEFNDSAHEP